MSGPDGAEEVFRSYNEQGFSRFKKIVIRKKSGSRIAKGSFEAGTCTAMSLLFLKRMMDNGSVTADDVGANVSTRIVSGGTATWSKASHQAAISQGAREIGGNASKTPQEMDRFQADAFGFKIENQEAFPLREDTLRTRLQKLVFEPGYYWFLVPSHAMAIVIDAGSAAWFFDPDEGLYKWAPPRGFGPSLAEYMVEDYADDVGKKIEILKLVSRY